MKKNKLFIITVFFCFFSIFSKAQEKMSLNSIPREAVHLSTNSNIFLVGEEMYYNFFSVNSASNMPSHISKIGYVELINENGSPLFKHKLKLNKGVGYGDYFIPSDIKTGQYKLLAYTKWIDDYSSDSFYVNDIYIMNPYLSNQSNIVESEKDVYIQFAEVDNNDHQENVGSVQIKTSSSIFKPRSLVSIDLKSNFDNLYYGNYSLSVRKMTPIKVQGPVEQNDTKLNKEGVSNIIPELRGEIISGVVKSKDDESFIPDIIVSLSIPGKNYVFKNVRTDQFGRFIFNLYENYETSEVLVQIVDKHTSNYKIILDDSNFINYSNLDFKKIKLNQNLEDLLVKQSIYNQIENAYYNSKKDSLIAKLPPHIFYGKSSMEYILDDYKRFPTIKETFIEVIQAGAIRNVKDDFKFKVYELNDTRYSYFADYETLVLLDGILIQDKKNIMEYPAQNIESVNLLKGTYFYGPTIFHGIIDMKTKQGDFKLPRNGSDVLTFNLEAPINSKIYYSPNYRENSNNLKRIPDYRNQLLWLPNLRLDSKLKTIDFYSSDVEGVFEIVLEGYTFDGKHLVSKQYFEVKGN